MIEFPPITIVVTVYRPEDQEVCDMRYEAMRRTIESWQAYLKYDGHICMHFADDSLEEKGWIYTERFNYGSTYSQQSRKGVGASLNVGFRQAFKLSPIVLYAVEDWSLVYDFDLTPWVQLLLEREDIGMVRLGVPHPNLTGRIEHLGELGWGLLFDDYSFTYGQRPALYHQRFYDHYGAFPENCSAIDCERRYAKRVTTMEGPKVMLALPHPWKHIDTISMSDWTPA